MTDIKLIRWATYLVPGSLVVFSGWSLSQRIFPGSIDKVLPLPNIPGIEIYVFLVLSYIIGISLWGLCYADFLQKWLRFNSHENRVLFVKKLLSPEWRQKKYFSKLKRSFPEIPPEEQNLEKLDYHDFEFILVNVHQTASSEMNDRIIQDRETVGLLQTLIIGLFILTISLLVSVIFEVLHKSWNETIVLLCAMLVTIVFTRFLYVHYDRRQHYLVRDALMAFLSEKD